MVCYPRRVASSIQICDFHELPIAAVVDRGVTLDTGDTRLFLPAHMMPRGRHVGDKVRVFVYADHDGNPQTTTQTPVACVGEFACMKCVAVSGAGAFLAWGIPKISTCPPIGTRPEWPRGKVTSSPSFSIGRERLIGSAQLNEHFDSDVAHVEQEDEVDLLVVGHTDAGVQVVVGGRHRGLIHNCEV